MTFTDSPSSTSAGSRRVLSAPRTQTRVLSPPGVGSEGPEFIHVISAAAESVLRNRRIVPVEPPDTVPTALGGIVKGDLVLEQAMAKDPQDRYERMDAFVDALEGLARDKPTRPSEKPLEQAATMTAPASMAARSAASVFSGAMAEFPR